jgi:ribosomal protein L33
MAWQKTKICLIGTETHPVTGKKVTFRYLTKKSKAKNKAKTGQVSKLALKKYHPGLRKHVLFTESKVAWK